VLVLQLAIFLVGPGLIAVWADQRFAGRRPTDLTALGVMVALAMVLCSALGPASDWLASAASQGLAVELIVPLTCGVLGYAFLSGLWLVRVGVEAMSSLGGR
jgi:hypothetical protein